MGCRVIRKHHMMVYKSPSDRSELLFIASAQESGRLFAQNEEALQKYFPPSLLLGNTAEVLIRGVTRLPV